MNAMDVRFETCWLTLQQVLDLLRNGSVTVLSNDRADVKLYIQYIDQVRAKRIGENAGEIRKDAEKKG